MDYSNVNQLAEAVFPYAVEARRHFHAHPELSNQEFETTRYILQELENMGIPCMTPAPTGVIAVLSGRKPGKTLGIRADIDALPIQELNEVPYCSQNPGVMHACGHDAHTAALLATARVLRDLEFPGTIKLIFQPAEEYFPSGALAMMSGGGLDGCDAIIGAHVFSHLPVGSFCVEPGGKMAASASVNIRVKGKGGHGGMPHQAVDATVAAAAVLLNLQTLASRELDVHNPAVITIGTLQAGTAKNIIAEEAFMTGTLRYFDNGLLPQLEASIRRLAGHTAAAFRAEAEVEIVPGLPAVVNDPSLSQLAVKAVQGIGGSLLSVKPSAGVDDFAYYAQKAPCLYAQIGAGHDASFPHHNPRFDLDERCLKQAVAWFTAFALDFLETDAPSAL